MTPTQTPKTDAVVAPYIGRDAVSGEEANALLDHARQLERELEETKAQLKAASESTHWQAICIHNCAAHIGPGTETTLDGLPMAVKRVVRDLTSHKAALEKAMALVERIEFIHADPLFRSVWFSAWNHGIDYTNGPKYDKELASLKEALTAIN